MVSRAVGRDDDALFVKDGVPVKFCFHRGVTQGRDRITQDVEQHGGQMVPTERLADVLLVDEQEDLAFFRRRYYSSTERYRLSLYVEPRGFVQACIRSGTYNHVGPVRQGMPGRAPGSAGRRRVPFTEEDRDRLAYYIATQFPRRDGRLGVRAYKDLEKLGETEDPSWAWARRHTSQSWREHYKKNPAMMDARIDYYLQRLKGVGHHLGHDGRTHDYRHLRQESEEEDEDEDEDEEQQWEGLERQDSERREQVCPAAAAERRPNQAARAYPARRRQDLAASDEEQGDGIQEEDIPEPRRVKHRRTQPDAHRQRDFRETQAKQARVSDASPNERQASDVEARGAGANPAREEDNNDGESQEIEGSDLFGDRGLRFDFDDAQDIDFPMPFSPRASPVPEHDGPPLSTQATLIASPRFAEKEHAPAPALAPTKAIEDTLNSTIAPSSRQTLGMTQGHARDASAPPGPSMPEEMRTSGVATAVGAPDWSSRPQPRSVELELELGPEPQSGPESQLPRLREDQGGMGNGEIEEEVLDSDIHVEEVEWEEYAEEDVGPVSVTVREALEDEMDVEDLLEASVDEDMGRGGHDEDDGDIIPMLPRFQVIDIEDEPLDSDDAETHASLVRGAVGRGDAPQRGESESEQDDEGDEDSDGDDNADRIERMASGSLLVAPASTPLRPRVTHSMTQTQTQQISPRRTRSGNQTRVPPPTFPSSGTKARAVVNRSQEEERGVPYAPPMGTRAATATKKRAR